jgi:hypothetical protein
LAQDVVVEYAPRDGGFDDVHERVTRTAFARRLAALMGFDYAGDYDKAARYSGRIYFVLGDTLVGIERAAELGIRDEHDLFGGVVPYRVAATKAITHPRIDESAAAPEGWSDAFPNRVRDAVLAGVSVFTPEQAREAGRRLLARGPVRLKPADATAGRGQSVVFDDPELEAAIAALDPGTWEASGLVLEENLSAVKTYSVGQVRVADLVESYFGTQRMTTDHGGEEVYGGSDLMVVRGGFAALAELALPDAVRVAVEQARRYDAATALLTGMFASRRNYDVAQGLNAAGSWRSGVLEQSWRIGGATGAEIAALEAFRADPGRRIVRASTFEIYGESAAPPSRAMVYFRGVDERIGSLTKYALVEPYDDT